MQNKPNFRNDKMSANLNMTGLYGIFRHCEHQKTKPIQTQFNPIQSQLKPKQTQFKPNCPALKGANIGNLLLIDLNTSGPFWRIPLYCKAA